MRGTITFKSKSLVRVNVGNKEAFFQKWSNEEFTALSYDQLTIRNERRSEVDWHDVDVSTHFSQNVKAKIPIMTSPMTTVTGSEMSVVMSILGGAGAVPHSYTPNEQKRIVRHAKLFLNGIVDKPIAFRENKTVEKALEKLDKRNYDFRSVPVIDENGRFKGLMTNTHFELYRDAPRTTLKTAMTPAKEIFTAKAGTTTERALELMRDKKIKILPLLDKDKKLAGMFLLNDVLRVERGNPNNYNLDDNGRLITAASVSTFAEDAEERIKKMSKYLDILIIDTSHGEHEYTFSALKLLKKIRKLIKDTKETYGTLDIIVGNISDANTAEMLAREEPDALRIGQGPGQICSSGVVLGGGASQATAVFECSKAAKKIMPKIKIAADGGIKGPAYITKALSLGGDFVIVGSLPAGTDETPGPVITRPDGTKYKQYNGEASETEQRRSMSSRRRYGDNDPNAEILVEGVEKEIPLKGPVEKIIRENLIGLKKQMSASGFPDIATMQRDVSYWKLDEPAIRERNPSQ
jgi:IMP dehydrogenase